MPLRRCRAVYFMPENNIGLPCSADDGDLAVRDDVDAAECQIIFRCVAQQQRQGRSPPSNTRHVDIYSRREWPN